jgi:hypothetical protein
MEEDERFISIKIIKFKLSAFAKGNLEHAEFFDIYSWVNLIVAFSEIKI